MRISTALAAIALSASSALAADYTALRGSQMGPTTGYTPSVPANSDQANWEGFYVGAFAGYSHAKNTGTADVSSLIADAFRLTTIQNEFQVSQWPSLRPGPTRSVSFGLFGGYNIMTDEVLIGLDLQGGAFNHKLAASDSIGRSVSTSAGYIESVTLNSSVKRSIDGYATARIRIGQAFGNFLPYIAGGFAVGKGSSLTTVTYRHTGVDADPASAPVLPPFDTGVRTITGGSRNAYAFGLSGAIGADFLIGSNMFGRAELSHTRFSSDNIRADISKLNAGIGMKF